MARSPGPHVHHHTHRLVLWQRLALSWVGGLLLATGVMWLAVHYTVGAGSGELPHPLEAWILRLHGLAAFGAVFLLGALASSHIPQGWRLTHRRRWAKQRRSGLLLCIGGALLTLTGYLLYYFASEDVRPALGWGHAAIGVSMALLVLSHRSGHRATD